MPKRQMRRRPRKMRVRTAQSIRSIPFLQYIAHQQTTTSTGVQTVSFRVTDLATDLFGATSARLVRLSSTVVRFYPTALLGGEVASVQLLIYDTTTGIGVPVTTPRPLSSTNPVTLRGIFERSTGWLPATSTNIAFAIQIYTNTSIALTYDIESRFQVAQDTLI